MSKAELLEQPKARRDNDAPEDNKKRRRTPKLFYKELSEKAGVEAKHVKMIFDAISELVATKLREDGMFTFPKIVVLRLKQTKGRPAMTRKMFGKEVPVAAKPAGKRIYPLVLKPLKVAVHVASE